MTTTEAVAALLASVGGNPDAAIRAVVDFINHPAEQPYDANGFSKPDANGCVRVKGVDELRKSGTLTDYQLGELNRLADVFACPAGLAKLTAGSREYAIASTAISWANAGRWGIVGGWIVHDVDKNPDPAGAQWLRSDRVIPQAYAVNETLTTSEQITAFITSVFSNARPPHAGGPVAA